MIALSGPAGGIQERTAYDAFGKPLSLTLPGTGNDMLYTGREYDRETGLYYYRARYYDPEMGRFISEDPLGFKAGVNFYAYVNNNPVNFNDPMGLYVGVDDAIFAGGGALIGVGAQGLMDLYNGELSSWQNYVAAGVGGAVAGETLLYAGPVVAGAAGGGASNITRQSLNYLTGKQDGFDVGSLAFDTAVGAATGLIPGAKVPGITQGRNSYNAIYKQMVTKFENGTISNVSTETAMKMFVGRTTGTSFIPGTIAATGASFGYDSLMADGGALNNFNDFGNPNLNFPTYAGVGGASGGFVLYPNKANTNMMRGVYSK